MAIQTFVASTVLTAAQMNALQANDYNQTVSTKTASYVLVAADKGTKIVMNAGATNTTITVNTSLFAAGDTLQILNISTSGICTITAGTATVSTTGTLALKLNAGGTLYFTSAGVSVFEANGVAATSSPIVQMVYGQTSTSVSSSSATFADTGLTATITPTSASNKVLVFVQQNGGQKSAGQSDNSVYVSLFRGASNIAKVAESAGFTNSLLRLYLTTIGIAYLDSPATTSATTYKTQFRNETNNASVSLQGSSDISTIVLCEVTI